MRVISEVLKKIMDAEKRLLDKHEIKHAPTIGAMYEGLTKSLLKKVRLDEYNINVVSGFIRAGVELSQQIDCMIVIGEGEIIPQTGEFIYPIHQVLVVIEVKKNLFAKEMTDAYLHLNEILRLSKSDYQRQQDEGVLEFSTARPAAEFMNLFGEIAPRYEDNASLPFHKRVIYHHLVREILTPVRIVIGYNGFKNESNFRNSLARFYSTKSNVPGYGVNNMPNLMISDGFSVIKTNGLPYKGFWCDEGGWAWLASSSSNPILLILELLYDRVELALDVAIDRGSDLEDEVLYTLILGKPEQSEQGAAWNYKFLIDDLPKNEPRSRDWAPLEISISEKELLELIKKHGKLPINSLIISEFKSRYSIEDIESFAIPLLTDRFILKDNENFLFFSSTFSIVEFSDRFYCVDSVDGRFKSWATRHGRPPQD